LAQDLRRTLALVQAESDSLVDDLRRLPRASWDGPSNCPPWRVRDLAAHVVSSGEGFVNSVRRGLAGSFEPSSNVDESRRRSTELEAAEPSGVADALLTTTREFIGLYDGLEPQQLEAICYHRRGNRSVRWYAAHRLAEIAFHAWDLRVSLGREPTLDDEVAGLLLPTLLESNVPRTYAAGLSKERGSGERYMLAVARDPTARWLVTIGRDELVVSRSEGEGVVSGARGEGEGQLEISGAPSTLALLVYGRLELPSLVQSRRVDVKGETALIDRFAAIFPRP
jgi:uncharacterized protein (TIGR03083 family)